MTIPVKPRFCYAGHPLHFNGYFFIRMAYLRYPTISDLIDREEKIGLILGKFARGEKAILETDEINQMWSERTLISSELFDRRYLGEFERQLGPKSVFLCHSSSDKGLVRRLHDDLKKLGVAVWLDENEINVGASLVDKISERLGASIFLVVCLSENSAASKWVKKEWQSFLARQLSDEKTTVLPALFDDCEIPYILRDIKYAEFRESFVEGFARYTLN